MVAYPKPTPRCLSRPLRLAEEMRAWQAAYARVTRRDGGRCRICRKRGHVERHHVVPRSLGGKDEPSNLILICGGPLGCHAKRHAGLIRVKGNADQRVRVWWDARVSGTGRERTDWR